MRAPGRINLIGEHTDYNEGFVLPAAINKYVYLSLRTRTDATVAVRSVNFSETLRFDIGGTLPTNTSAWGQYVFNVVQVLHERYAIGGLEIAFGGDIPLGAGMSSSAALCCGLVYGLSELFGLDISRPEIALMAQATEHRIGINCGLMDQYAVLFGQYDRALLLDCQNLQYDHFPLELGEYALVLINSMVEHELAAESGYNDRRRACERVVARIQEDDPKVKSLRAVSQTTLEAYRSALPSEDYQRARYVLHENERVLQSVAALQDRDVSRLGKLMYQSHQGMRDEYQITTPELDQLVAIAQREGAIGARMMGGGFGGCTINLIEKKEQQQTIDRIVRAYHLAYRLQPEVYELNLSDGVTSEVDKSTPTTPTRQW